MRIQPAMAGTEAPPVMEARRWIAGVEFPVDRPLLNVSQAAPVDVPPLAMREAIARFAIEVPQAHLYGPVLGIPELRATVASEWSEAYGGAVDAGDVAITSGCNQAFAAAVATLAGPEDEVLLPTPWYFNHKMWLDMSGIRAVPTPCGAGMLPDLEAATALITDRTRAIVLVTPNNPTGAEYPVGLVRAFFEVCRARGIALILDETYRDFHSVEGAPHDLFTDPDWRETLIQLYSFSKAYRLTGHRVGALVATPARLAEVEKFLDTVSICANQLGQMAALWGMRNLRQWLGGERAEILARRAAVETHIAPLPGWEILGVGAYFAYMRHPYNMASDVLTKRLVSEASVLALPGTMFTPAGDTLGQQSLRIAFANIDASGIHELARRLGSLTL
ncbi:aminotransferase [Boseongicola aestuarii]|uniref:aspartate transaminase n=1 Tax=Boseongicola aestuarii TaxID=1470561 RepID=A0A238IVR1_9RHOB|nr:aminotransferase [Boseongicola aestuarii]SMX22466.1 Arginine--pyruvate transaminase AruH [Boseongicola aestuarii]